VPPNDGIDGVELLHKAEQAAAFLIGSEDKPSQDNEHG
jgi:hypothetical protein